MRHFIRALIPLVTLLAGCVNLAPHYERPAAPVPASYPQASPTTGNGADIPWQDFFADDRLRNLIDLALANNRDLRVAVLNIEQARAQYRIQEAQKFPALELSASESASRVAAGFSPTGTPTTSRQFNVAAGISGYELDLFGRVRNLGAQALQEYLATEEARRATHISLVAEVASSYLNWSADVQRLALARDTLRSQGESYALIDARFSRGFASELDLRQVQTTLDSARVDVARYTAQLALDGNAMAVLIGQPVPEELVPPPLDAQPDAFPELRAGLPSELMLRRPDLLQAEHQLRASTANIGVARAAFYPSISLTTSAGRGSTELSDLFGSGSGQWSFAPQINLPIFAGGANLARLRSAKAGREISVAQYEKSIQLAFREVADALAQNASIVEQLNAQRSLVEASDVALRLSAARFTRGFDSYLSVLDAQRSAYNAQQGLINTRLTQLSNSVTLYKALGGGWSD